MATEHLRIGDVILLYYCGADSNQQKHDKSEIKKETGYVTASLSGYVN